MQRVTNWLIKAEQRMLLWANRRPINLLLNRLLSGWLGSITHLGGATFTLTASLMIGLLASPPWSTAGWQALTAVALSHLPVALVKRKFKRLRPYQALSNVNTGKRTLLDPSFPSGHTTAVCAWLMPWLFVHPEMSLLLLTPVMIIGISVAWSRMYLGLHYPSDVAAGAALGSVTALLVVSFWPAFA
ncbi:phosphatase PAP2 family protein [Paenibacillus sp. 1P07SE]|uniref:phosphatase PAP2 family protein n=1 Tax=Paenibacillus sp. 1P07SE TaxID=3132209 RepID=UPI0039A5FB3A